MFKAVVTDDKIEGAVRKGKMSTVGANSYHSTRCWKPTKFRVHPNDGAGASFVAKTSGAGAQVEHLLQGVKLVEPLVKQSQETRPPFAPRPRVMLITFYCAPPDRFA